jgi:hypothetical protein
MSENNFANLRDAYNMASALTKNEIVAIINFCIIQKGRKGWDKYTHWLIHTKLLAEEALWINQSHFN